MFLILKKIVAYSSLFSFVNDLRLLLVNCLLCFSIILLFSSELLFLFFSLRFILLLSILVLCNNSPFVFLFFMMRIDSLGLCFGSFCSVFLNLFFRHINWFILGLVRMFVLSMSFLLFLWSLIRGFFFYSRHLSLKCIICLMFNLFTTMSSIMVVMLIIFWIIMVGSMLGVMMFLF